MTRAGRRAGFTLLELLAALALTGLALLSGILLLDQVTDGSGRIVRRGVALGREGNGLLLLRQLLLDARAGTDSLDRFRGDERSVDFTSVCPRPGGWLESCRVSVSIDRRPDTSVVVANLSTGEVLDLARRPGHAELRFFDGRSGDSVWTSRWASSMMTPVAIGFVLGADTVVYPFGSARD